MVHENSGPISAHARTEIAKYNLWRLRAVPFAEKLAERIDALQGAFYPGCGFHYSVEEAIVKTTHLLAEPQPYTRNGIAMTIIIPILLESEAAAVKAAEQYVEIHGG